MRRRVDPPLPVELSRLRRRHDGRAPYAHAFGEQIPQVTAHIVLERRVAIQPPLARLGSTRDDATPDEGDTREQAAPQTDEHRRRGRELRQLGDHGTEQM